MVDSAIVPGMNDPEDGWSWRIKTLGAQLLQGNFKVIAMSTNPVL